MWAEFFRWLLCELLLLARYLSIFRVLFKSPLSGLSTFCTWWAAKSPPAPVFCTSLLLVVSIMAPCSMPRSSVLFDWWFGRNSPVLWLDFEEEGILRGYSFRPLCSKDGFCYIRKFLGELNWEPSLLLKRPFPLRCCCCEEFCCRRDEKPWFFCPKPKTYSFILFEYLWCDYGEFSDFWMLFCQSSNLLLGLILIGLAAGRLMAKDPHYFVTSETDSWWF